MKKSIWILAVAALALFAACNKYDDSAIRSDLDALKTKVEGLEKTLNQTVTDLQALSKKLDNKLTVTSVTESGSSYVIAFSDGTTATISNGKDGVTPVIGIKEVDGMYYWTVNGELVVDAQGKPIPVAGQGPIFRAGQEEGTLEFSVDGGATWQPIAASSVPVEVEETDTEFILIIGESRIVLPKEVAFTLNFNLPSSLVIAYGETSMVAYSVAGAASGEVEVDVLNNGQGFEATVIPANDNAGAIAITNKTNDSEAVIKVFVYATNHTGKSDIKAIVFRAEAGAEVVFEAVLDAQQIPAEGGDFTLKVSSDEDYKVSVDADWVTVTPTRALYEDSLPVSVEPNMTYEQRSAIITVASKVSDKKVTVAVLQEAAEEPEPEVDYDSFLGAWKDGQGILNVAEFSYTDPDTGESYEKVLYELNYTPFDTSLNNLLGVSGYEFPFLTGYTTYEETPIMYFMCTSVIEVGNWHFFFAALDDGDYIEYGGEDMDIPLASAIFNEDGSFTIYGNEYDAVYNGKTWHEVNVGLSIFATLTEAEEGLEPGDYSFKNMPVIDLPATFTEETLKAAVTMAQESISKGEIVPIPARSHMSRNAKACSISRFLK